MMENKPFIINISGTKKGAGKTELAVDLAKELSEVKISNTKLKVLLIDCDMFNGNVLNNLGVIPKATIEDWIKTIGEYNYKEEDVKLSGEEIQGKLLNRYHGKFDYIPAPSNPRILADDGMYEDIGVIMNNVFNNICEMDYDFIIIDNGIERKDENLVSLFYSDLVLWVNDFNIAAIQDVKNFKSHLKNIVDSGKVKVVFNMTGKRDFTDYRIKDEDGFLKDIIIATIPNYIDSIGFFSKLLNGKKPLTAEKVEKVKSKDERYTKAISSLANYIIVKKSANIDI